MVILAVAFYGVACQQPTEGTDPVVEDTTAVEDDFVYKTEQFADIKILRYKIPGFEDLDLEKKKLLYYLYQAAYSGRDMIWDQNYKHNMAIRRTLEEIVKNYQGDKESEDWKNFMVYTKRVWFSNGIHHHYSMNKFNPEFSAEYFAELVRGAGDELPLSDGETVDDLIAKLTPVIFDPEVDAKRVNLDPDVDPITASANNFYEGVTDADAEAYYEKIKDKTTETPISYGLNSKMVMTDGQVEEIVWKVGGMYNDAIVEVVKWLELAQGVAENDKQREVIEKLIKYYHSGDLADFDDYSIAWVEDVDSRTDFINGFIEVYGDAKGYRGTWESVVSFKDMEATKRIAAIGDYAQWFEDNSSIMDEHKKADVTGISAKVITVVAEAGDASPSTPIGINLPNANWIRANHGSKSVNLGNIVGAYEHASKSSGALEEFAWDEEEIRIAKAYGGLADNLHTDMHEVIGHASGVINPGIGTPKETLKNYSSTLEEGRADLVALYFLMDEKLIEIGVMDNLDVGRTQYDSYIANGLMLQLVRIEPGEQIEESHMRNRQLVAKWCYEKGLEDNVIEKKTRDGKTFFVVNDYEKLRDLFGQLLRELQRIKSEGDYEAGKALVENYGVKVDPELHAEVLERYESLNIAPYSGFINPVLEPVMEDGEIVDIAVKYPDDFSRQMLYYARQYSFLPTYN
jgi:dipeptidyl-peptidase-3